MKSLINIQPTVENWQILKAGLLVHHLHHRNNAEAIHKYFDKSKDETDFSAHYCRLFFTGYMEISEIIKEKVSKITIDIPEGLSNQDCGSALIDEFMNAEIGTINPRLSEQIASVRGASSCRHYVGGLAALKAAYEDAKQGRRPTFHDPESGTCSKLANLLNLLVGNRIAVDNAPLEDFFKDKKDREETVVFFQSPAFLGRTNRDEESASLLRLLKFPQKTLFFCSGGFLFRSKGEALQAKTALLHSHRLESVISLDEGMGLQGSITQTALLIWGEDTVKQDTVKMQCICAQDKSDPWKGVDLGTLLNDTTSDATQVSIEDILLNGCNMTAKRYVQSAQDIDFASAVGNRETKALGQMAEILRGQTVSQEGFLLCDDTGDFILQEITPGDINEIGIIQPPEKLLGYCSLGAAEHRSVDKYRLRSGDILLCAKGRRGKVGTVALVEQIPPSELWYFGQLFYVIRLTDLQDLKNAVYLLRYLQSKSGQAQLNKICSGTSILQIKFADLKKLPVPIPLPGQTENIYASYQHMKISWLDLREREAALLKKFRQDEWKNN